MRQGSSGGGEHAWVTPLGLAGQAVVVHRPQLLRLEARRAAHGVQAPWRAHGSAQTIIRCDRDDVTAFHKQTPLPSPLVSTDDAYHHPVPPADSARAGGHAAEAPCSRPRQEEGAQQRWRRRPHAVAAQHGAPLRMTQRGAGAAVSAWSSAALSAASVALPTVQLTSRRPCRPPPALLTPRPLLSGWTAPCRVRGYTARPVRRLSGHIRCRGFPGVILTPGAPPPAFRRRWLRPPEPGQGTHCPRCRGVELACRRRAETGT